MLMELDAQEVRIIERHREELEELRVRDALQKLCAHEHMNYAGHSHNDSAYKCRDCGHIEWR